MATQPDRLRPPVPTISTGSHDGLLSSPADTQSRRPISLPTPINTDPRHKRRSANYVRTQPANAEVISSLIDSLSAISLPAQSHFDNFSIVNGSVSSPASPNAQQTQFGRDPLGATRGNSMDYMAYRQSLRDNDYLYPDDAAEPPVIRTAKPPSGLSPLTAPKKKEKEKEASLKNYLRAASGSSASLHSKHSTRSLRTVSSIGNISIEAGPVHPSNASRTSAESKESSRARKGLLYMPSRERLRSKDAERKRGAIPSSEAQSANTLAHPTPQLLVSEDTIKEEPAVAESSRAAQRKTAKVSNALQNGASLLNGTNTSPNEKGLIPERASSLRHSGSPSRRKHGRRGSRHDNSYKTKTVPEEDETENIEVITKDKILQELEAEDNEVAQRIRELRKKKLLRDKIAGKFPVGVDAGADSPSAAHVSPIASAEPSPTSTVSSVSEKRTQDLTKAHKILGITMPSTTPAPEPERRPPPVPGPPLWREAHETQRPHGHTRTRSLTVNDSDDITPLPINYKLALQSLDSDFNLETASSNASSKGTASSSPSAPQRSKSFGVGGRSAVGRKSMVMGATNGHRHSTSTSSSPGRERTHRAASEEIVPRQSSVSGPSSGQVSGQPRQTLKKKRWSHPDLPARAEQTHGSMAGAVQSPPQTVVEERPSSADSVDVDVERYLNAPRLSQKVKHPTTGRVISFSEVGDPKGFAIFCCVGMGLTRYIMGFYDQLAITLRLRLITPERPGVGGSEPDPNGTPLSWADDVLVICQALKITKFSLLAHSAGAIYALATALRMPQHIRGRVHLLAPWIPPSQMAPIGVNQPPAGGQLPRTQRFLRVLPPALLKVANSSFLSATSASLQRTGPKNSPKTKRKSLNTQAQSPQPQRPPIGDTRRESIMLMDQVKMPNASSLSLAATNPADPNYERAKKMKDALTQAELERCQAYEAKLTFEIWDRATTNANPATDLVVCLETRNTIGFRYEDITRGVVIHHGSKDSRVPVDNVRWLGSVMRRCEVRILEGEHHGLMASGTVMGNVLTEMAREWEDWTAVVQGKAVGGGRDRSASRRRT